MRSTISFEAVNRHPVGSAIAIPAPIADQLRRWVSREELAQLLREQFVLKNRCQQLPRFDCGVLRFVNSAKLTKLGGLTNAVRLSSAMSGGQEAPGTFMVKLDSDGLGAKTELAG
jgi:hypothetical protein